MGGWRAPQGDTLLPLEGQNHTASEAKWGMDRAPKVATHQSNCALSISQVSLLDQSIPERVSNDTDKIVCEHKPGAAVRYPVEGSEKDSSELGVASRDEVIKKRIIHRNSKSNSDGSVGTFSIPVQI